MNPAVTFAPLARDTRSVILASGTLTPTTSFQSELGTKFPRIVNPNHIIPKDQIYIRCIPRAPNGQSFKVVYEEVNKWTFQVRKNRLLITLFWITHVYENQLIIFILFRTTSAIWLFKYVTQYHMVYCVFFHLTT